MWLVFVNNSTLVSSTHQNGMFTIVYYNARNVLPKMDKLAANCQLCGPDIACIVESWLCSDTTNNEISLSKYTTVCLDRNRCGGGILVFIKNSLVFEVAL